MTPRNLIDMILWYRDHYHKSDNGHNAMIRNLLPLVGKRLTPKQEKLLEEYAETVDTWLNMEAEVVH